MSTTSPRWLVQLSDVPWLLVAGALGLVLEAALRYSGVTSGTPWWVVPARGALAAGGICGWLAFRFGRRAPGPLLGAVAGVTVALLPPPLLSLAGIPFPGVTPPLALGLGFAWALLPPLTHTLVLPLLEHPAVRRLAAHHPLYAHLGEPRDASPSRRPGSGR